MADPYPIRPITADEFDGLRRVHSHAFNSAPLSPARLARARRQFEPQRSLAAIDAALPAGEGLVGTTGAYSLRMTVPGAVLPVAGVTAVSVLPSHRRRGVLRSLMHQQLADIAARGEEPVAALWAAETPIYGRYGYGCAASKAHFEFGRGEGALDRRAPTDPALSLRLAEPRSVAAELAKAYDAVLPGQPGFFVRDDDWWDRVLHDESQERAEAGPLRCLLDRDLVTSVTADLRSASDPVLFQLLDMRRARLRVSDGIWVRIIDLPAALSLRAYSCPVDVVLEVTDALLPANAGRWRLRADGSGSVACDRTDEPAGLALDIRDLGAAYLGGTRLGTLAAAGLAREVRPGPLARLSTAMTWDPAPWCPQIF